MNMERLTTWAEAERHFPQILTTLDIDQKITSSWGQKPKDLPRPQMKSLSFQIPKSPRLSLEPPNYKPYFTAIREMLGRVPIVTNHDREVISRMYWDIKKIQLKVRAARVGLVQRRASKKILALVDQVIRDINDLIEDFELFVGDSPNEGFLLVAESSLNDWYNEHEDEAWENLT